MMLRNNLRVIVLVSLLGPGCSSHLIFLENSHMGLTASFEPNSPTPAEVDLGWRRAMFAMVPQKSKDGGSAAGATPGSVSVTKSADGKTKIEVVPDPNELMSLYTVFKGNIGFNDPIEIHHFMATGVAAANLLANHDALRTVVDSLQQDGGGPKEGN